jgi:hypothetical protein
VNEPSEGGGVADYHEVFLLDTETGRVWMYGPGLAFKAKDGKTGHLAAYFSAVPIDGLTGEVEQEQFETVRSINSAQTKDSGASSQQPAQSNVSPK